MGKLSSDVTTYAAMRGNELLSEIRRQSKPRRFFWQEKTVRDLVEERRAELVDAAITRTGALSEAIGVEKDRWLHEVQRQSKPRRFFWQQKTAYDKAMEHRERVLHGAATRVATLAEMAAERRAEIAAQVQRQSKPRRFFWQEKTAYDKLSERRDELVTRVNERTEPVRERIAERTDALAARAAEQRDHLVERGSELRDRAAERSNELRERGNDLLNEARRQSKPRRFFWQEKTAYDKAQERRAELAARAAEQRDHLVERGSELRDRAAERSNELRERGNGLLNEARRQSKPRRFFWQEKTAYDKAQERKDELFTKGGLLAAAAAAAGSKLLEQAQERSTELAKEARYQSKPRRFFWQEKTAYDKAQERMHAARESLTHALPIAQNRAESAATRVQHAAIDAVDSVKTSAVDAVDSVKATAANTADSVKSAAQVPGRVVRSGVKAGQRTVRHSVRLMRVFLWALAIGMLLGLLLAPRAGAQLRADLQRAFQDLLDAFNPDKNRDLLS